MKHSVAFSLKDIPIYSFSDWKKRILHSIDNSSRISALFGVTIPHTSTTRLYCILVDDETKRLSLSVTDVEKEYLSLTPQCPQAHRFEREIVETLGVTPLGHPALKPIRNPMDPIDFFKITGEETHEVAVGPVHAGVIEPGHFRFQCNGEEVFHLEIALGYQHRGIEHALIGGPNIKTLHLMETLAGDTSVGHSLAYCQALEGLLHLEIPSRARLLRQIALELERLANHVGDLGVMAADIGFLPTASFCGRIRGDFLNLTSQITGNRMGRGWIVPGGVRFDLPDASVNTFLKKLKSSYVDAKQAIDLLWESPSVMTRFENTGTISKKQCLDFGFVGPVARAAGIKMDVRDSIKISTHSGGDVYSRAHVRWQEIHESCLFLLSEISSLPHGAHLNPLSKSLSSMPADHMIVSLIEGWRGEICHAVITDHEGRFLKYKIVDPSFHNWPALELAMRNQQISDFPLCNKSFNLSYCGHDL